MTNQNKLVPYSCLYTDDTGMCLWTEFRLPEETEDDIMNRVWNIGVTICQKTITPSKLLTIMSCHLLLTLKMYFIPSRIVVA
jgi:hypothetical protein